MNKASSQIKESIIEILRHHKGGLSISEISKKIHVYRATTSKYLALLHHQGIVSSKRIGPSKLYFLTQRNVHHISSSHRVKQESDEWIDEFIEEVKEELKKEILGSN